MNIIMGLNFSHCYEKSDANKQYYLVLNTTNKKNAANILGKINTNIIRLSEYLYKNKDVKQYKKFTIIIESIYNIIKKMILAESSAEKSYSVNNCESLFIYLKKDYEYNDIIYNILCMILHSIFNSSLNIGYSKDEIFQLLITSAVKLNILSINIYYLNQYHEKKSIISQYG